MRSQVPEVQDVQLQQGLALPGARWPLGGKADQLVGAAGQRARPGCSLCTDTRRRGGSGAGAAAARSSQPRSRRRRRSSSPESSEVRSEPSSWTRSPSKVPRARALRGESGWCPRSAAGIGSWRRRPEVRPSSPSRGSRCSTPAPPGAGRPPHQEPARRLSEAPTPSLGLRPRGCASAGPGAGRSRGQRCPPLWSRTRASRRCRRGARLPRTRSERPAEPRGLHGATSEEHRAGMSRGGSGRGVYMLLFDIHIISAVRDHPFTD